MASETMRRLDEIVGSFREGVIVRVSCGGILCGECIQCTARAAKASLQREQRAAQDEIARLARELEEARERERALREALMAISARCYEAVMQTPLLEHQSMHALAGACKQDADAALAALDAEDTEVSDGK